MNRTETLKIMSVLKAAYPQFYAKQTKEDLDSIVHLWESAFCDESYPLVANAIMALIKTRVSNFPPSIGELNQMIQQISQPEEMSEGEAWAMVYKAICSANYHAAENFERLPPTIQRIVGSPKQLQDWAMMDSDTVNSVVASNLQRSFKAVSKKERDYQALPSSVKGYMEKLSGQMELNKLTDKITE